MNWYDVGLVALGAILLTTPANWLVRAILHRARGKAEPAEMGAGRWIGVLERLLIYVLVLVGEAGAAGLVAAAKTILRFPEISAQPAKIAPEYVLVGSLASWLLAFAVAAVITTLV